MRNWRRDSRTPRVWLPHNPLPDTLAKDPKKVLGIWEECTSVQDQPDFSQPDITTAYSTHPAPRPSPPVSHHPINYFTMPICPPFHPSLFYPNSPQIPLHACPTTTTINIIHQDAARIANESSSSTPLNGRPPPIAAAEKTLPTKTKLYLHNWAQITVEYLVSTRTELTWQRSTIATTTVIIRLIAPTTFSTALPSRLHWQ